jgi:hypothetical protein
MSLDAQLRQEVSSLVFLSQAVRTKACCPEPHHVDQIDEQAHRAHHWLERLKCLAFCTAGHVLWEVGTHVLGH